MRHKVPGPLKTQASAEKCTTSMTGGGTSSEMTAVLSSQTSAGESFVKRISHIALLAVLALCPLLRTTAWAVTDSSSPVGVWKTFDDKTGQAKAIVRIYEVQGKLFGKIVSTLRPGAERICTKCTDSRRNQPMEGLVIIRDMKAAGSEYTGGDILDPENGSIYRCRMHVVEDGTHLVVRGYLGISLLGRSQTWARQPDGAR